MLARVRRLGWRLGKFAPGKGGKKLSMGPSQKLRCHVYLSLKKRAASEKVRRAAVEGGGELD